MPGAGPQAWPLLDLARIHWQKRKTKPGPSLSHGGGIAARAWGRSRHFRRHKTAQTPRSLFCIRDARLLLRSRSAGAANEILHFFQGNEAIFLGIHRLEDALVSRLKLLQ